MLTPALNLVGVPMPIAVGSSLAQMIGGSLTGCIRHARHGNIVWTISLVLGLPLLVGVYLGRNLMLFWHDLGVSEDFPRITFIVTLLMMSAFMLYQDRNLKGLDNPGRPPRQLTFKSGFFLSVFGVPVGLLSGILGMGGGFFMVPILSYMMGLPPAKSSGSSLCAVLIGSIVGALSYYEAGLVDVGLAVNLMSGSVIGAFIGAGYVTRVDSLRFRRLFIGLVLVASLSMVARQLAYPRLAAFMLFGSATLLVLRAVYFILKGDGRTVKP